MTFFAFNYVLEWVNLASTDGILCGQREFSRYYGKVANPLWILSCISCTITWDLGLLLVLNLSRIYIFTKFCNIFFIKINQLWYCTIILFLDVHDWCWCEGLKKKCLVMQKTPFRTYWMYIVCFNSSEIIWSLRMSLVMEVFLCIFLVSSDIMDGCRLWRNPELYYILMQTRFAIDLSVEGIESTGPT